MRIVSVFILSVVALAACDREPPPPEPEDPLVAAGRVLFFEETFAGNGRTCGTCHPAENNFTLDRAFIATLPADDPLFVAETNPDLGANFENPVLMRGFGLIVENLDGFGDLPNVFTMRGIPHTLALATSVTSQQGPRTGWSGDGAPGDGSLRAFATGAVIQHFTRTTNRVPGVDFRLPTAEELDALEAFQRSLGRQADLTLPLPLKDSVAVRGQALFNDPTTGKCFACHVNAGANGAPAVFGADVGNLNFNTGVEALPDQPPDLTGERIPPDDGFGIPGDSTFNTPSLVEAADTPPFFHTNAVETLEGAVAFYNGDAFNTSPAGQLLVNATGSGINLDVTQVEAVTLFLRVINALENIRQSTDFLEDYVERTFLGNVAYERLPEHALFEIEDALQVLEGFQPEVTAHLREAQRLAGQAVGARTYARRSEAARGAMQALEDVRNQLVEPQETAGM